MNNKIQVLKPFFRTNEVLEELRECFDSSWVGMGGKSNEFEKAWSKYSGFENCHFLNSATAGLHLALDIFKNKYNWGSDSEIVTTALTFVSTNHAILYNNLTPVFADVDESLCLSPASVKKSITKNTKAVIFVGVGGNAKNYKEIKKICDEFGLLLILDAAHMAGTKWVKTHSHVGLDADVTIFSFQAVKNLPTSDSGMICFKEGELDFQVRKKSWLGITKSTDARFSNGSYQWRYDVDELGYKYNGNSLMAAVGLVSLRYLDEDNNRRRQICQLYMEKITSNNIMFVQHSADIISSRHLVQILVNDRDQLIAALAQSDIYCGVHYISNNRYDLYKNFKSDAVNANNYSDKLISLPLHLHLTDYDINRVCDSINSIIT